MSDENKNESRKTIAITAASIAAVLVAAFALLTPTQRAASLGFTQHGALITAQDAGAADAVAAVAISPGTVGQVLTVGDAGLPVWQAASGGGASLPDAAGVADGAALIAAGGAQVWTTMPGRISYTLADFSATAASGTASTTSISGTTYHTLGVSSDPIRFDSGAQTAPRYALTIPAGARRVRVRWRVRSVTVGTGDGYDVVALGWYDSASTPTYGVGHYQIASYSARASSALTGSWGTYPGTDLIVGGLGGSTASTTWHQLSVDVLEATALSALGTGSGDTPPTSWTTYGASRLVVSGSGTRDADSPGVLVLWIGRPDSASSGAAWTVALDARVEIDT